MSSPAGAQPGGGAPSVYQPQNQPYADTSWYNTISPLVNASAGGGAGTPAGWAYPQAQGAVEQGLVQSPYAGEALAGAAGAGAGGLMGVNAAVGGGGGTPAGIAGVASSDQIATGSPQPGVGGLGLPGSAGSSVGGSSGGLIGQASASPFGGLAVGGALEGANIGMQGAGQLGSASGQVLNTAFDPQQQLYNQGLNNAIGTQNVLNAESGLAGTPYGASVAGNTANNFNLGWRQQQLGNQEAGLNSAMGGYNSAANLATTAGAAPEAAYYNNILQQAGALNAGMGVASTGASLAATPYNTGATMAGNAITGLTNTANLGQAQYQLPQQVISDLQSYEQGGQQAALDSSTIGLQGMQEEQASATGFGQALSGVGQLASGVSSGVKAVSGLGS